jgi:hypothetical protein
VLRRRYHALAQAAREAEGRQEADEARRPRGDPAGSLPRRVESGIGVAQPFRAAKDGPIQEIIAKLIERHALPIDASEVAIEPGRSSTAIDASYEQQIEVLPKYFSPWKFDVKVDVMHVRPTSVEQIPR